MHEYAEERQERDCALRGQISKTLNALTARSQSHAPRQALTVDRYRAVEIVGTVGGGEQAGQRVGCGHGVVVHHPHPCGALRHRAFQASGETTSTAAVVRQTVIVDLAGCQPASVAQGFPRAVCRSIVDDVDTFEPVRLRGQRRQTFEQQEAPIVGDDDYRSAHVRAAHIVTIGGGREWRAPRNRDARSVADRTTRNEHSPPRCDSLPHLGSAAPSWRVFAVK